MQSQSQDVTLTEYDHLLYNIIQNLDKYAFHQGTEGKAYFIDDKFVVKEYVPKIRKDVNFFDDVFDSYCSELKQFAEDGYAIPKFYSWLKVPNANKFSLGEKAFSYYILQEKMPGRWMYNDIDEINDVYELCKHLCSYDDYLALMADPFKGNPKLRREILKTYISDYIKMNQMIESLPAGELEKFVMSAYEMHMNGKFSFPDLYIKNVLIDQSRISLIDNRVKMNSRKDHSLEEFILNMLDLLEFNESVTNNRLNNQKTMFWHPEINKMIKKNSKLSIALAQKIMNILFKQLQAEPINSKPAFFMIASKTIKIFGDDADKVWKLVPTEFEKYK